MDGVREFVSQYRQALDMGMRQTGRVACCVEGRKEAIRQATRDPRKHVLKSMKLQSAITLHAAAVGHELVHEPSHWRTVCVDFDGVLNASDGPYAKNHFGAPIAEGLRLLRMLIVKGWNVVILTARKETDSVAGWLKEQGFPGLLVTNHKIPAQAYVDDRGVHWHEDQTAEAALQEIEGRPGR
jgi:hypothetical protein